MLTKTDLPSLPRAQTRAVTWGDLAAADAAAVRAAAGTLRTVTLPPVNTALVSPVGFDPFDDDAPGSRRPVAQVRTTPSGTLRIVAGKARIAAFDHLVLLSAAELSELRQFAGVRVPYGVGSGPVDVARLVRQLLVGGVPVLGSDAPVSVRRLLGPALGDMIAALTTTAVADLDAREQWSVDARRLALLSATSAAGVPAVRPTVTAVVSPDDAHPVDWVLRDLRSQTWSGLTVVVAAADDDRLPDHLPVRARVVRAATRAEARSRALVDCDTMLATVMTPHLSYGPEHVRDLVLGHHYGHRHSRRPVTGVVARRTHIEPLDVTVRAPGTWGERPAATFTGGTVLGAAPVLVPLLGADANDDVIVPDGDGYAIHDRNVVRSVRRGHVDLDTALRRGTRQVAGTRHRLDPAYTSYFARVDAGTQG